MLSFSHRINIQFIQWTTWNHGVLTTISLPNININGYQFYLFTYLSVKLIIHLFTLGGALTQEKNLVREEFLSSLCTSLQIKLNF